MGSRKPKAYLLLITAIEKYYKSNINCYFITIEYDVIHVFMLVLFYLCLHPHSLNTTSSTSLPTSSHFSMVTSSSLSSIAATVVTTRLDKLEITLKPFSSFVHFTGHIARALVWCNVHTV